MYVRSALSVGDVRQVSLPAVAHWLSVPSHQAMSTDSPPSMPVSTTTPLYRRFFSSTGPIGRSSSAWLAVGERGGAGLVAVTNDSAIGERIVVEASYELLPNGNGELAITVDRGWRGWLGPYLLDALVDAAAARDAPNLEAEVLATNGPMLALLRSRGYAAVPNGDWTVVRAMIGTTTPMPVWHGEHRGLRVLVEGAGGHWHAVEAASAAGMEVLGMSRSRRSPLAMPGPRRSTLPAGRWRRRHRHLAVRPIAMAGPR